METFIIKSDRGGPKLGHDGHIYTMYGKPGKKTRRWKCKNYPRCKVTSLKTTLDLDKPVIIEGTEPGINGNIDHCHMPDAKELQVAKLKAGLKESAMNSREKPMQVLSRAIMDLPLEVQTQAPLEKSLKRTVARLRKKHLPSDPKTLSDYVVLERHRLTYDGNRFLLYDSKDEEDEEQEDEEVSDDEDVIASTQQTQTQRTQAAGGDKKKRRLIIWATDDSLKRLADAEVWHMDGTFGIAPKIFYQVYLILAKVEGVMIPLVYSLMTNKDKKMYSELFTQIKVAIQDAGHVLKVRRCMMDFESAVATTAKSVLKRSGHRIKVSFCFFHLAQSLYKQVRGQKLTEKFKNNIALQNEFSQILAISFVRVEDMEDAFEKLYPTLSEEGKKLADHIDHTYLRGEVTKISRQGTEIRSNPMFDKEDWNVHELLLNEEAKTNNITEAYNHRLKHLVGVKKPSPHVFCDRLLEEHRYQEGQIARALSGQVASGGQRYVRLRKCLKRLVEKYDNSDLLKFVKGAANNIKLRDIHVEPDEENCENTE